MEKMDEQIMVVRREELFNENYFQGFASTKSTDFEKIILKNFFFIRREEAEENPELKQPIAYVIITNLAQKKIFTYRRSSSGGEGRLFGKWSIGVGGHIDKADFSEENPIHASVRREISEETNAVIKNLRVLGYINDDLTSVGKVHFGILYLAETNSSEVIPISAEMSEGKLRNFQEIETILSSSDHVVEEWTRISFEPLKAVLV